MYCEFTTFFKKSVGSEKQQGNENLDRFNKNVYKEFINKGF